MIKPLILVVGMHRSGTSLAMQMLEKFGVGFGGALLPKDEFNENGYWEAPEIVDFHNELLSEMGRGWGLPEHAFSLEKTWFDSAAGRAAVKRAKSLIGARIKLVGSEKTLALKDPRCTLFLPVWIAAARAQNLDPRIVICMRHPVDVAASLEKRDKLNNRLAELYWLNYSASALYFSRGLTRQICFFQDWSEQPELNIQKLRTCLRGAEMTSNKNHSVFDAKLTAKKKQRTISSHYLSNWWSALTENDDPINSTTDMADFHIHASGSFQHIAHSIRGEVGDTKPYLLARDLENYRKEFSDLSERYKADQVWIAEQADALKEKQTAVDQAQRAFEQASAESISLKKRAEELLHAYQSSETHIASLYSSVSTLEQEREKQTAKANEYLAAYQASEKQVASLKLALQNANENHEVLAKRADELLFAYQTEAARMKEAGRSFNSLIAERDGLAARAKELLDAYHVEAAQRREVDKSFDTLVTERDGLAARAKELLEAYHIEAAQRREVEKSFDTLVTERDGLAARANELLLAYQTEQETNQKLREKLKRLNPLAWFRT